MPQTLSVAAVERMASTPCDGAHNFKRNSRERKRVQHINVFIRELKNKLPVEWTSKKMGKLEILQKSTLYIKHLMDVLKTDGTVDSELKDVMAAKASPQCAPRDPLPTNRDCEKEVPYPLPTPAAAILDYKTAPECSFVDDKESLCMQQELYQIFAHMWKGFCTCDNFKNESARRALKFYHSALRLVCFREPSKISSTYWFTSWIDNKNNI